MGRNSVNKVINGLRVGPLESSRNVVNWEGWVLAKRPAASWCRQRRLLYENEAPVPPYTQSWRCVCVCILWNLLAQALIVLCPVGHFYVFLLHLMSSSPSPAGPCQSPWSSGFSWAPEAPGTCAQTASGMETWKLRSLVWRQLWGIIHTAQWLPWGSGWVRNSSEITLTLSSPISYSVFPTPSPASPSSITLLQGSFWGTQPAALLILKVGD